MAFVISDCHDFKLPWVSMEVVRCEAPWGTVRWNDNGRLANEFIQTRVVSNFLGNVIIGAT